MREIIFNGITYFNSQELRCKGSGMILMAKGFPEALLALRLVYAQSMPVTSVCRSQAHNTAVGGAPSSYHICDTGRGCAAADVIVRGGKERARFIKLALALDWSVGVHRDFIHIDRRIEHGADQLLFMY